MLEQKSTKTAKFHLLPDIVHKNSIRCSRNLIDSKSSRPFTRPKWAQNITFQTIFLAGSDNWIEISTVCGPCHCRKAGHLIEFVGRDVFALTDNWRKLPLFPPPGQRKYFCWLSETFYLWFTTMLEGRLTSEYWMEQDMNEISSPNASQQQRWMSHCSSFDLN